jgi:hypothetical protein
VPDPNTDFISIAGGGGHSLGVKSDGTLVAWGGNGHGQCDVPEPNSDYVMAVSAVGDYSFGVKAYESSSVERVEMVPLSHGLCARVHPNPVTGGPVVSFTLESPGDVTLRVIDVLGREIARKEIGGLAPGIHMEAFSASARDGRPLPAGVYWIELEAGPQREAEAFVLLR